MKRFEQARHSAERYAALAATGLTVYGAGREYYKMARNWYHERYDDPDFYLIITEEDEDLWYDVRKWVLGQVTETDREVIEVLSFHGKIVELPNSTSVSYPVKFGGETIDVVIQKPDPPTVSTDGQSVTMGSYDKWDRMVFKFTDVAQRSRFKNFLVDFLPEESDIDRKQRVYRSYKGGGWRFVKWLPHRSLESLVLPEGMLDTLVADIRRFESNQQRYIDRGLPWHRGYLLSGEPGTGKSSTIATLGDQLGRDVYFATLKDLESDSALITCVSEMQAENGIFVLEDVDVVKSTHDRDGDDDEGGDGVTLQGLLNVLDGLLTPEGMVTFMTTNHLDDLDPALIRPGRADLSFKLNFLTQDQLDQMIGVFVGPEHVGVKLEQSDVTPSQIVECLKSSFDQPDEYVMDCIREVVADPIG